MAVTYEEARRRMLACPTTPLKSCLEDSPFSHGVQYDLSGLDPETMQALSKPILDTLAKQKKEKLMLARTEELPCRLADARGTLEDAAAAMCRTLNGKLADDGFSADNTEELANGIDSARMACVILRRIEDVLYPKEPAGTRAEA